MNINHVTLLVEDKARAEAFYTKTLGFERQEGLGSATWIKIGDQFIHLTSNSGMPVSQTFYHFCIAIDGLKEYLEQLIAKGVDVFDLDADQNQIRTNADLDISVRQFFIRDPDGNLIEFCDAKNPFFKGKKA
jgi:catechol 2,3-dioxygenase-like lactoylglutathione lyase family enzyme